MNLKLRQSPLAASTKGVVPDDRFDLLIHALSQLPDDQCLTIVADGSLPQPLSLLADAYGVKHRIQWVKSLGTPSKLVYPSIKNLGRAPISPDRSCGEAVIFDPAGDAFDPRVVQSFGGLVESLAAAETSSDARTVMPDATLAGHRVTIVTNVPMHYRIELFSSVADRLAMVGAQLHVCFVDGTGDHRSWNVRDEIRFDHTILPDRMAGTRAALSASRALYSDLRAVRASLVVVGGFAPQNLAAAIAFTARQQATLGLWSGDISASQAATSTIRRPLRRWAARRAQFGLAYGYAAGEYLKELAPAIPVVYVRNTSPTVAASKRSIAQHPVELLAVAQLIPRKGLELLIDALAIRPDLDCRLAIGGVGPLREPLIQRSAGDPRVRFIGPVASNQMAAALGQADVFLFPSHEDIFGLTLVEAMGSGLAVATSKAPGAVEDLAVDGLNALVVPEQRPEAWAAAIAELVADGRLRRRLGAAAASTVERRWTLQRSIDAWVAGLNLGAALGTGRP